MLLQPGESIWLGLANEQRLEPWFKLITLEFFTGGVVPIEYKAGFEDGSTITWSMNLVDSTTIYRRWEGRIDPQPGWEWVRLYNQLDTEQSLRIESFTSKCVVPVPGAAMLTVMGAGMVDWLRRRNAV